MCGIVGYITTEENKEAMSRYKFLHQALIADTMRGDDSTGAFFVGHDHERGAVPAYCKSTAPGYDFVSYDPDWHSMSGTGKEFYAAIGHNRSATVGKVHLDTAHPFRRGPITLVHNGTLRNTYGLPISEHAGGFHNDSDAIAGNLEHTPIMELTKDMFGAYTLIWHDSRDNTLNIVRNDQRPLFMATVKGQNTIFLASESMMMQWILSRLKIEIETIAYPKPHQWLRFEHGSLTPEIQSVPEYVSSYSGGGYSSGYGWESLYDDDDAYGNTRPKVSAPHGATPGKPYSKENRITIGGRKQAVPTLAQELLLEFDLLVEDRERFEPLVSKVGTNSKLAAVHGYLPENGMSAVVYGVPGTIISNAFTRQWVVQPLAIKMVDHMEPIVVCKLRHTDADSRTGETLLTPLVPSCDEPEVIEAEYEDLPPKYVTTDGMVMELHDFMNKIGGGCIRCSGNIYIGDAEELIWVNNRQDPCCPACVEEIRKETDNEA
jgi:hypothetical protein